MARFEPRRARAARNAAGLALALAIAGSAAPAHASGGGLGNPRLEGGEAATVGLWLGYNAVIFGGLDIVFAVIDRPAPPVVSLLQIAIGGVIAPAWALSVERQPTELTVGAAASIVGHNVLGFYNLLTYPAWKKERERERAERFGLAFEPQAGGGLVRFRARL